MNEETKKQLVKGSLLSEKETIFIIDILYNEGVNDANITRLIKDLQNEKSWPYNGSTKEVRNKNINKEVIKIARFLLA